MKTDLREENEQMKSTLMKQNYFLKPSADKLHHFSIL